MEEPYLEILNYCASTHMNKNLSTISNKDYEINLVEIYFIISSNKNYIDFSLFSEPFLS